jgi:hypothetical protein
MIAVTGRQGRRRKKLLDDLKEKTGNRKLKSISTGSHCRELDLQKAMDLGCNTM